MVAPVDNAKLSYDARLIKGNLQQKKNKVNNMREIMIQLLAKPEVMIEGLVSRLPILIDFFASSAA